jgi:hypothetical protein
MIELTSDQWNAILSLYEETLEGDGGRQEVEEHLERADFYLCGVCLGERASEFSDAVKSGIHNSQIVLFENGGTTERVCPVCYELMKASPCVEYVDAI